MILKKFILVVIATIICLTAQAATTPLTQVQEFFQQAGRYYKQGDYLKAGDLYRRILDGGWESGAVYFNLANSYFKEDDLGRAILNYERARLLLPRDPEVRANWEYARSLVRKDVADRPQSFWSRIQQSFVDFFSLNEMTFILVCSFGLMLAGHILCLYFPVSIRWRRIILAGLAMTFLLFLGGTFLKIRQVDLMAVAVEQTPARFEPRSNATVHFSLPPGTKVRIIGRDSGWVKILRVDQKKAWVPLEAVERI